MTVHIKIILDGALDLVYTEYVNRTEVVMKLIENYKGVDLYVTGRGNYTLKDKPFLFKNSTLLNCSIDEEFQKQISNFSLSLTLDSTRYSRLLNGYLPSGWRDHRDRVRLTNASNSLSNLYLGVL